MASALDIVVAAGTIKAGKLLIRNRRQFDEQLAQFKDGIQLEVTLQRLRATRSIAANAYYWGVVLHLVSEMTGDTVEDLHDYFKKRFNPKPIAIAQDGEDHVTGASTRHLNTSQFYEYVEKVRQFAAEFLDLNIPDANTGAL